MEHEPKNNFESSKSGLTGEGYYPGNPNADLSRAGYRRSSARSLLFRRDWRDEQATRLHNACERVERLIAHGVPVRRATYQIARNWEWQSWFNPSPRAHFRCDRKKPVRLSQQTLVNALYAWRKSGRSPEAFRWKSQGAVQREVAQTLPEFLAACLAPGVSTFAAACVRIGVKRTRAQDYVRAVHPVALRKLRSLFKGRKTEAGIKRQFAKKGISCQRYEFAQN